MTTTTEFFTVDDGKAGGLEDDFDAFAVPMTTLWRGSPGRGEKSSHCLPPSRSFLSAPLRHLGSLFRPNKFTLLFLLLILLPGSSKGNEKYRGSYETASGRLDFQRELSPRVTVGIILPHMLFAIRMYQKAINKGIQPFEKHLGKYQFVSSDIIQRHFKIDPSPNGELSLLSLSLSKKK